MKKMLLEILLTEGKRENIAYCVRHGIDPKIVDEISTEWDVTPTKKYTLTILRWFAVFLKKQTDNKDSYYNTYVKTRNEDDRVHIMFNQYISIFRNRNVQFYRLNPFKFFYDNIDTDIQQFKDEYEFADFVSNELEKNAMSKKQQIKVGKDVSAREKVFENDKCSIFYIKKREAACIYGKGTKWCITQLHMPHFDNYDNDASIYFVISKSGEKTAILSYKQLPRRQYQFTSSHCPKGITITKKLNLEAYNSNDDLIWASDMGSLTNFYEDIREQIIDEMLSNNDEDRFDSREDAIYYLQEYHELDGSFVHTLFHNNKLIDLHKFCEELGIPNAESFFVYKSKTGETNEPYGV